MLTLGEKKIEEPSLSIKSIGQHQIKGPGIALEHACQQTLGAGDFIFSPALRLHIQQEAQGLGTGSGTRQQHQSDMAVIVLNAFSSIAGKGALQTGRAMAA